MDNQVQLTDWNIFLHFCKEVNLEKSRQLYRDLDEQEKEKLRSKYRELIERSQQAQLEKLDMFGEKIISEQSK